MTALSLRTPQGRIEHLRQMLVFGESRADWYRGTIEHREDEDPWSFFIDQWLQPAGRRGGKSAARRLWIDEWHLTDSLAAVRALAARALSTPKSEDMPAVIVHWACPKPTDPPVRVLYERGYTVVKQGLLHGHGDLLQIWMEKGSRKRMLGE